jgi:hypothetical protein
MKDLAQVKIGFKLAARDGARQLCTGAYTPETAKCEPIGESRTVHAC